MSWDIVGHERAVDLLRRGIARGRVSHAYLFSGPPAVGKRRLALELARALNCERLGPGAPDDGPRTTDHGPTRTGRGPAGVEASVRQPSSSVLGPRSGGGPPCGACRRCRLIDEGKHPEVRVVGLAPPHRVIRVAEVESIQADAALRPADAYRKVYIIEQAELLHPDAANRLLKTIEEPPESVVMVLTTVDPEATLPTIVSRCQHIRLRPLARADLARYLVEAREITSERAELLAALGEGRVGWALHALDDGKLLERRARLLDDLAQLLDADRLERLQYARALGDRWSARPESVREALETWLRYMRDVLLLQGGVGQLVNVDRRAELERHAKRLTPSAVAAAVAAVRDTLLMLDQNVNARLALDVVLLDVPRPGRAA